MCWRFWREVCRKRKFWPSHQHHQQKLHMFQKLGRHSLLWYHIGLELQTTLSRHLNSSIVSNTNPPHTHSIARIKLHPKHMALHPKILCLWKQPKVKRTKDQEYSTHSRINPLICLCSRPHCSYCPHLSRRGPGKYNRTNGISVPKDPWLPHLASTWDNSILCTRYDIKHSLWYIIPIGGTHQKSHIRTFFSLDQFLGNTSQYHSMDQSISTLVSSSL